MYTLWRFMLACLLAVALPLQGVAAQAMLTCGPAHHQAAAAHEHAMHEQTVHQQAMHEHGAAAVSAADGSHAHQPKAVKAVKGGPAGKCSACASCCGASAMTTATLSVEVIPTLQVAVVATIPAGKPIESIGGLDRPPRPVLA